MEGKSDPPEERRISHEKKERRNGRKIPAPRGAANHLWKKKPIERWKESPTPPKSGESHMRRKKGETEGKFRPPGEPRIPREGKTSYPEPRYLPPVYLRDNTHSRTTPDSSPMRGRTKGKREGCGHRNDGVFTPKQRAQQLQQNFARVVFFFCPHSSVARNPSVWPDPATTNAR